VASVEIGTREGIRIAGLKGGIPAPLPTLSGANIPAKTTATLRTKLRALGLAVDKVLTDEADVGDGRGA
jgi:hypothetical protein